MLTGVKVGMNKDSVNLVTVWDNPNADGFQFSRAEPVPNHQNRIRLTFLQNRTGFDSRGPNAAPALSPYTLDNNSRLWNWKARYLKIDGIAKSMRRNIVDIISTNITGNKMIVEIQITPTPGSDLYHPVVTQNISPPNSIPVGGVVKVSRSWSADSLNMIQHLARLSGQEIEFID